MVLLCRLVRLTDSLDIQSSIQSKGDICYKGHEVLKKSKSMLLL